MKLWMITQIVIVMLFASTGYAALPSVIVGDTSVRRELTALVAITFWQDGWQHVVLQPVAGPVADTHPAPSHAGWLIPVPSQPLSVEFAPDSLVDEVWRWVSHLSRPGEPGDDAVASLRPPPSGYMPTPIDADYSINVLPHRDALLKWSDSAGFARMPEKTLDLYEENTSFIAVTAALPSGSAASVSNTAL